MLLPIMQNPAKAVNEFPLLVPWQACPLAVAVGC
jgi:hypothetical protein